MNSSSNNLPPNSSSHEAATNLHQAYELALLRADKKVLSRIESMMPDIAYKKIVPSNQSTRPIFYWLDHILNLDAKEKKSPYVKDLASWLDGTIDYIKKNESSDEYIRFLNEFYITSALKNITGNKIDDDMDSELYLYLSIIATRAFEELSTMSQEQCDKLINHDSFESRTSFIWEVYMIGRNYISNGIYLGLNAPQGLYYDFKLKEQLDLMIEREFNSLDYSQDFVKVTDQIKDIFILINDFKSFKTKEEKIKTFFHYLIKILASYQNIINFELDGNIINTPFLKETIDIKFLIPEVATIAPEFKNSKVNKALFFFILKDWTDNLESDLYDLYFRKTPYHLDINPEISKIAMDYTKHCTLNISNFKDKKKDYVKSKMVVKDFIYNYVLEVVYLMKNAAKNDEERVYWLARFKEILIFTKKAYQKERQNFMSEFSADYISKIKYIENNRNADIFINSDPYLKSITLPPLEKKLSKSEETFYGDILKTCLDVWLPIMVEDYIEFPYVFNFEERTIVHVIDKIKQEYPGLNLATPNNFLAYRHHESEIDSAGFKKNRIAEIESKILYSEIKEKIVNKNKKSGKI